MSDEFSPDPVFLSAQLMATELISELLASTGSGQLPQKLTEQLRELTGARTVLLIVHPGGEGAHELLYACPPRRASMFSVGDFDQFCPNLFPEEMPHHPDELPTGHLLREPLRRAGVESLVRFPLRAEGQLVGSLLLLDLPDPARINEVSDTITLLLPVIGMALKNALAHRKIEEQARDLERRVAERTEELKAANESLRGEVAERRRAERDLRRSEERYRTLVETTYDWVWELDVLGRYTYASPKVRDLLGYEPEEVLGRTPFDLMPEEEARRVREAFAALAAERKPFVGLENLNRHRDGRLVTLETVGLPIFTENGEYCGYWGMDRDITERKQMEAEKQQLEANLRQAQKMEAIGTLAGGIAHDFNNILTPIMGHGELALMQLPEGDPVRDDISELLGAAERAASLVKQILAISRREDAGAPVPVNVGALVKETAKFLRASIPSTIELRIEVDPACGPVLAEPSRLHQVILNLCTNASYAMAEKGGTLTLSLRREEGAGRRRVNLTVSDTGQGIPAEVQARIFEPYFTTKPTGKGSGLGLAVVHGIVTTLGGEIRVRSVPGNGATFEVLLPETARAAPARHVPVLEVPRGLGQRVLAVDDELPVRSVLERLLTSLGYEVTVCGSGPEALGVFRAKPEGFDLVLTDYTMPGMTGLVLAAELRALRPKLPIVLGTGFAEGVDDQTVGAAGLRGPVMKPYSAQKLGEVLRAALEKTTLGST